MHRGNGAVSDEIRWPVVTFAFPITLTHGDLTLRPLRLRDGGEWRQLRLDNLTWLGPWEATSPVGTRPPRSFGAMVRANNAQARRGHQLPLGILLRDRLVGQITLNPVSWGSMQSASLGYWVSQHVAGRGLAPLSVALLTDHALFDIGLHRVEINIRPENHASLRVAQKLAFRDEGIRERFLHIDGQWRDHRTFAVTVEDVPDGLTARFLAGQVVPPTMPREPVD